MRRPFRLHEADIETWIAPVRTYELSTLAYTDADAIHYVLYTFDSVLVQCVWARRMKTHEKVAVFAELKDWYTGVSNNVMTSNMTSVHDTFAWELTDFLP